MKNIIIKYGVIYGLFSAVLGYFMTRGQIGIWSGLGLALLSIIVFAALGDLEFRRNNEGSAYFGELVKVNFGIILIGTVLSLLIGFVENSMITEEQKAEIAERMKEEMMGTFEWMGLPEEQLDEMEEEMEEQFAEEMENRFKPSKIIMSAMGNMIFMLILSMIPAAIIRRD